MSYLWSDPSLQNRALNEKSITFELNMDTSDCPESFSVDIDDEIVIFRAEGQTSTANAVECIACCGSAFTAPVDACGIVGFLLQKSKFEPNKDICRVHGVEVLYQSSGTSAITLHGATRTTNDVAFATGITADGNIAFSLDSSANFASTDYRAVLRVNYRTRP